MQNIDLMISGGKTLLLDSRNTSLENACIAIHATEIIEIGTKEELCPKYNAKKVINAENSLVMPGFVNCHATSLTSPKRAAATAAAIIQKAKENRSAGAYKNQKIMPPRAVNSNCRR